MNALISLVSLYLKSFLNTTNSSIILPLERVRGTRMRNVSEGIFIMNS